MARPSRNNADYFTHYTNLKDDRRVKAVRTQFGAAGYGVLIMLYEALTDADGTQLNLSDATEIELLAGDFGVSVTEINSLLQLCVKIGLFRYNEHGNLHSPDLDSWLEPVFAKRNRSRAVAESRQKGAFSAQKEVSATDTPVSVTETPHNRVEKSIIEKKKKSIKKDAPPTALVLPPSLSEKFLAVWGQLCQSPKWRSKPVSALQLALNKLTAYEEGFAILLMERAIMGNYQGVVFTDTQGEYLKWKQTATTAEPSIPTPENTIEYYLKPEVLAERANAKPLFQFTS